MPAEIVIGGATRGRLECRDGRAKTLEGAGGRRVVGLDEEEDELLAAVPAREVDPADRPGDRAGDGGEGGVPGLMPVRIVEGLEVVEVEHREREGPAGPLGPCDLGAGALAEGRAVQKSREGVGRRAREESSLLVGDRREEEKREEEEAGAEGRHDRPREEDRVPLGGLREAGEEKDARRRRRGTRAFGGSPGRGRTGGRRPRPRRARRTAVSAAFRARGRAERGGRGSRRSRTRAPRRGRAFGACGRPARSTSATRPKAAAVSAQKSAATCPGESTMSGHSTVEDRPRAGHAMIGPENPMKRTRCSPLVAVALLGAARAPPRPPTSCRHPRSSRSSTPRAAAGPAQPHRRRGAPRGDGAEPASLGRRRAVPEARGRPARPGAPGAPAPRVRHRPEHPRRCPTGGRGASRVPPGARLGIPVFSPDGSAFAFTRDADDRTELWLGETKTGARRGRARHAR